MPGIGATEATWGLLTVDLVSVSALLVQISVRRAGQPEPAHDSDSDSDDDDEREPLLPTLEKDDHLVLSGNARRRLAICFLASIVSTVATAVLVRASDGHAALVTALVSNAYALVVVCLSFSLNDVLLLHLVGLSVANLLASLLFCVDDALWPLLRCDHASAITFWTGQTLLVLSALLLPLHWYSRSDETSHPYLAASIVSRLLFAFVDPALWVHTYRSSRLGQKKGSSPDFLATVPKLPRGLRPEPLLDDFRWPLDRGIGSGALAFAKHFRSQILVITVLALLWVLSTFLSPLALNLLLNYVQDRTDSRISPYVWAVGLLVGPLVTSMALQQSMFLIALISVRLRTVLAEAVFRKILRMKQGGGGGQNTEDTSKGRANNLVATDLETISTSLETSLQLLAIPIKILVSLSALYLLLGWSAFVALGVVLLFTPLSLWTSKQYSKAQESIMIATDKRVNAASELLGAIRTIKISAWEEPMKERIVSARAAEIGAITRRAKVYAVLMCLSTGVPAAVSLATIAAFTFGRGIPLRASVAFTSLALFSMLREAVVSATFFASAYLRAKVSLNRIGTFLTRGEELDNEPLSTKLQDRIMFEHAILTWHRADTEWQLSIDDLEIPTGCMTLVTGAVGSGKSALLHAMLGEMHVVQGSVCTPFPDSMAYAAQQPWLQDRSIRDNICFARPYERSRYKRVVFECGLEGDLQEFERGDKTRAGELGAALSGGQRARVALARAVYSSAQLVLLDDILSAVDVKTAAHLAKHCLDGELLRGRTVVIVSHAVALCARSERCKRVLRLAEGRLSAILTPSEVLDEGLQDADGERKPRTSPNEKASKSERDDTAEDEGQEYLGGSSIPSAIYKTYLASMGGVWFWLLYVLVNVVAHVLMLGQNFFLGIWTSADDRETQKGLYFLGWAAIQIGTGLSLSLMYLYLIFGGIQASKQLHAQLLLSLFNAPLRFWNRTPLGRVTNRMSKDMMTLDTQVIEGLQPVADYGAQVFLALLATAVLLPSFLLPAAILAVLFYLVGQLYIRNALPARQHASVSRSPMLSTLAEATSGTVTIRAFRQQERFAAAFLGQTARYNRLQLYEYILDRWLELRSDAIGALVAFAVGLLSLSGNLTPGAIGFLLSTGLEVTGRILFVVRAINESALNFNSVARLLEYAHDVEQEPTNREGREPERWPRGGAIKIEGLRARYGEKLPEILKGIDLAIPAGTKVGIVGPTGCGKSTLMLALLRLIDVHSGSVLIDGIDTKDIDLTTLRRAITFVPQEPVSFAGSLRENLDPLEALDDVDLWDAVRKTGFSTEEKQDTGLDEHVAHGGSNLSQGQRQLLNLARAIASQNRQSKIVILDEATASIDVDTEEKLTALMREAFEGSTCLIIAHRLKTVRDCDLVVCMAEGRIVEQGPPDDLLARDGTFRQLWDRAKESDSAG